MNTDTPTTRNMLAQADLLLLLAEVYRSPAAQNAPPLADVTTHDADNLLDAAGLPDDAPLRQAIAEAIGATEALGVAAWSDEYHRLFEGAMLCPLNESAYVRRDKGAILGDLCAFYRAFGWQPAADTAEKPDHLATELEFMSMLLIMLARAEETGQVEHAAITRDALGRFAGDHPGDWVDVVCDHIIACTRLDALAAYTRALAALWKAMTTFWQWPTDPTATAPAPAEEPESPYECAAPGSETTALTRDGRPVC